MHPIINIADIVPEPRPAAFAPEGEAAGRYGARIGFIGSRIGARKLEYNLTVLPPGQRAFPFHNHHMDEEMFFVLAGNGTLRLGAASHPIRQGDIIACPPGGPETAHQIVNTGTEELRFLAVSTSITPDICEYPDSGKFAVMAVLAATPDGTPRRLAFVGREAAGLDYWEGE
jgi:uncharacterized cupin superfamily protein